jgi:hypothetical protein
MKNSKSAMLAVMCALWIWPAAAKLDDATSTSLFARLQEKSPAIRGVQLDLAELHKIEDMAELSAARNWCRLAWEPHFLSFMQQARQTHPGDERITAAVAQYHGIVMGLLGDRYKGAGDCQEQERAHLNQLRQR